jgi:hypothetical protein
MSAFSTLTNDHSVTLSHANPPFSSMSMATMTQNVQRGGLGPLARTLSFQIPVMLTPSEITNIGTISPSLLSEGNVDIHIHALISGGPATSNQPSNASERPRDPANDQNQTRPRTPPASRASQEDSTERNQGNRRRSESSSSEEANEEEIEETEMEIGQLVDSEATNSNNTMNPRGAGIEMSQPRDRVVETMNPSPLFETAIHKDASDQNSEVNEALIGAKETSQLETEKPDEFFDCFEELEDLLSSSNMDLPK